MSQMILQQARIDLDEHPYEYYTCGNVIRGSVHVHPIIRPEKVNVFFRAQCKMKVVNQGRGGGNGPLVYEEKILLFSHGLRLFESSQPKLSYEIVEKGIGKDGTVGLPFQFIFPSAVQLRCVQAFEVRRGFENEAGHALPPSSSFVAPFNRYIVEYWVEAQILGDKVYRLIQAVPFRSPVPPIDQTRVMKMSSSLGDIHISSRKLHPDYDPNEKFLRKIKNSLTAGAVQVPWVQWKLTAQVPSTLLLGAQIPIRLSLKYIGGSGELLGIPAVFIRRAQIKLVQKLTVRAVNQGFHGHRDIDGTVIEEMVLFHRKFPENGMLLYDGQEFADLGVVIIPTRIIPSFKTYGARLEYSIHITIDGDCAKESFKVSVCEGYCTIVCYTPRPPPLTSEQTPQPEELPPFIDPPPYENT